MAQRKMVVEPDDSRAELEALKVRIAETADAIDRDLGSRWGEEKFNDGVRAATAAMRAAIAAPKPSGPEEEGGI